MITQEEIQKHMRYADGKLFWQISPGGGVRAGAEVGNLRPDGYRGIGFRGKLYKAHRLIFLYHHGYFPEHGIDHINKVRDDNRIENLREASQSCNMRNIGMQVNNTSGIKGVYYHKAGKNGKRRSHSRAS